MDVIQEIKKRIDIVSLISERVALETRSANPKARCPFHQEKTPSFVVYPRNGTWRCFGACSTGGNAFDFIMKHEGVTFKEALQLLAKRTGVKLTRQPTERVTQTLRDGLYGLNALAHEWFVNMLFSEVGKNALRYLHDRGMDNAAIKKRGIGYAPAGQLTLIDHLHARRIHTNLAIQAGLIKGPINNTPETKVSKSQCSDLFTDRVTFAITDQQEHIVGFGARALGSGQPKYINTPQTEVFNKGATLYGLNWAQKFIQAQGRAIVVEGYMDAITAHENGFNNTVASMGVAITDHQLLTLARLVRTTDRAGDIVLCLDNDEAGSSATLRSLEKAIATNYSSNRDMPALKVAMQTNGKDPDEAIKASAESWRETVANNVTITEYLIEMCRQQFDLSTNDGKGRALNLLTPFILATHNPHEQDDFLQSTAELLDVSRARLKAIIQPPSEDKTGRQKAPTPNNTVSGTQIASLLATPVKTAVEDDLLATLMQYPEARPVVDSENGQELFSDNVNQALFDTWKADGDFKAVTSEVTAKAKYLREKKLLPLQNSTVLRTVIYQYLRRLKERSVRQKIELAGPEIQLAEKEANAAQIESLLEFSCKASRDLKNLFLPQ